MCWVMFSTFNASLISYLVVWEYYLRSTSYFEIQITPIMTFLSEFKYEKAQKMISYPCWVSNPRLICRYQSFQVPKFLITALLSHFSSKSYEPTIFVFLGAIKNLPILPKSSVRRTLVFLWNVNVIHMDDFVYMG